MNNGSKRLLFSIWILSSMLWTYIHNDDYLGCFQDDISDIILKQKKESPSSMTIPWCHTFCKDNHFMYAGLRSGIRCLCDSVVHVNLSEIQLPDSDCSFKCQGDTTTNCGGWLKTSLYYLDLPLPTSEVVTVQDHSTSDFTTLDIKLKTSEKVSLDNPSTSILTTVDMVDLTNQSTSVSTLFELTENRTQSLMTQYAQSSRTTTGSLIEGVAFTTIDSSPITTKPDDFTNLENNTMCSCTCIDVTSVQFLSELKLLVQNITVDKKQTSSYIRSKISVYDSRVSSVTIGGTGIVFISLFIFLFVASDLLTLCNKTTIYSI